MAPFGVPFTERDRGRLAQFVCPARGFRSIRHNPQSVGEREAYELRSGQRRWMAPSDAEQRRASSHRDGDGWAHELRGSPRGATSIERRELAIRRKITDLREDRAGHWQAMQELSEAAEAEGRDLTADEHTKYKRHEAEFDSLGGRVERLEREAGIAPNMTRAAALPERVEYTNGETADLRSRAQRGDVKAQREYRATDEYRDSYEAFVRARGAVSDINPELRAALAVGTDSTGGYLVPDQFFRGIVEKADEVSIVRPFCTVITTGDHGDFLVPKEDGDLTVTWLAEGAAYTESEPTFAQTILKAYKAGLIAKASDEMLSDPFFDILAYLAKRIGKAFGKETGKQYVNGTSGSTTTPEGFVNKATVGKQGATGQTTTVIADDLIDVQHSLLDAYRATARWFMRDASVKVIRKLKDGDNQYLWRPGLEAGSPDILLGSPITITPDVPAMAASAKSIAYGDLEGYWIRDVENLKIKILNELYAANGQVGVRPDLRTDGDLIDTDSVKLYQNSAT